MRRFTLPLVGLYVLLALATGAFAQSPLQTLKEERLKVGTPMSPAQDAAILNATALKHGLFLLSKPGGNHCPLPGTGEPISCDYLVRPDGGGFDVLSDQENAGIVVDFNINGNPKEVFASERLIAPFGHAVPPTPEPVPVPPPAPTVDLGPLTARVDALSQLLDESQHRLESVAGVVSQFVNAVQALTGRVSALEARPVPVSCTASVNIGIRIPISCAFKF